MTEPTRLQLLHLANRARDGVALPAEHDQLAAGITAVYLRLADTERVARSAARDAAVALTHQLAAEAAIERALSPDGIRAAREELTDQAITHLGRDLGTIHAEAIAEATVRAALDQAQQPTTGATDVG